MKLRKLKIEDASLMLGWMHDDSVVHNLRTNFAAKTIEDCVSFINFALNDDENLHLAIADDNDEYMGTVSLKHITDDTAEFGITVRKCAMGKGYSIYGMQEILDFGFLEKGLSYIYWCVDPANFRAVRFYDKNGYTRVSPDSIEIRGVQRGTDSELLLVSYHKGRREKQSLQLAILTKLNTDVLFLRSVA